MSNKVACILFLAACASSGDDRVTTASEPAPTAVETTRAEATPVREASAPATPTPPSVATPTERPAARDLGAVSTVTPTAAPAASWRDRVKADIAGLQATAPQLLAELTQLAPTKTRAGFVRFTSDAIHDPRAASVLLERLARGGESDGVRAALVEALPRTGGRYADAVVELFAVERSAHVRTTFVHAARRAPAADAVALLTRALGDSDAEVQAEAARSAAAHPEGARLATQLRTALASSSPIVRAESARSLGILKIAAAKGDLAARISDGSADVRLEALRAIDRIEPGAARALPLAKLATDEDPRVVALATRLSETPSAK